MNKKGFTLVELLAVIAILAILVIIALPNVMGMFNESKKSSFTTELKEIYKVAQQQWMMDSMMETKDQVYSRCKTCTGKSLQLSGRQELDYYIKIDKSGKVVKFSATDGTYQFSYTGDLLATQINDVEEVAKLGEDDILKITNDTAYTGAGPKPVAFATDSWDTIQKAVQSNNTAVYSVGDTKQVNLGSLGTHTVRIANKSTPSECGNSGFSQTACGFVIEFADVVVEHRMNPYEQGGQVNGDGNKGGWEYCEARQYLNTTVYNSFPDDLKNIIIDTFAVSEPGGVETTNFLTTDKLFLLSKPEVGNYTASYSRQLDYYSNYSSNMGMAIKKMDNEAKNWCLRTADKGQGLISYRAFWGVRGTDGFIAEYNACTALSPAFRIG